MWGVKRVEAILKSGHFWNALMHQVSPAQQLHRKLVLWWPWNVWCHQHLGCLVVYGVSARVLRSRLGSYNALIALANLLIYYQFCSCVCVVTKCVMRKASVVGNSIIAFVICQYGSTAISDRLKFCWSEIGRASCRERVSHQV